MYDLTDRPDLVVVRTFEQVMEVWDERAVLVRSEPTTDGALAVSVYPQLGRGFAYPDFNMRAESCLRSFGSVQHALLWARGRGYEAIEVK